MTDPIPPGHGEAEPVGARPGDYCWCGLPLPCRCTDDEIVDNAAKNGEYDL